MMGKRGPKKIPTIVLRNRGSWLAGQRRNEPKLPVKAPEPPGFLSKEAKAEWDRVVPLLMAAGVVTEADRAVLVCYCEAWSEYVEMDAFCRQRGKVVPMVKTDKGNLVQNPAYGLRNTLRQQVKQLGACLGLNPADRANIKAAPQAEPESAKKRFFKGA